MKCTCERCMVIGGSSWQVRVCNKCGNKWQKYTNASEWQYEDCYKCQGQTLANKVKEVMNQAGSQDE